MLRTTVGGSSSKSDLENSLSREELSPLIDDEDANEQLPLKDIESFPRKKSSIFSSKSPGKESTSTSMFKFPSVSENHESSVEGTTTIDIEPFDSLDDCQNRGNINEVPNITVSNEEEHQGLTSSQFFSYIYNICEGEGFDKTDFYQNIDLLHAEHCLYDVLLLLDEEDQDTLLHVAIKKGQIDLTKEILHILDEPYNSFYKDKYFQREKPLSKVINTKNREGKDVITLVIEGNNPECILTAFERLTPEDFNRRRDAESGYTPLHEAVRLKSSNAVKALLESEHVEVELLDKRSYKARKYINDKETAKLFIEYYNNKISNLKGKIADSDKRLMVCEYISRATRYFFVSLIALSSGIFIYNQVTKDTSNSDDIIRYIVLVTGCSGLIALVSCLTDVVSFHCCKKENSHLKEELNSCEREKYESECKLFNLQKEEAPPHTGANLVPPRGFQVTSVSGSLYSPERPNIHIP